MTLPSFDDSREIVELTRRLVAAASPNPPGDERAAAAIVQEALTARGLPAPRIVGRVSERPNILLTLEFGPGGRHLCLSGHLDTKPVGQARWRADPFAGTVDGDRLYGLGAADMKGAIAAMVCAAARLAAQPPGAGRLSLLFTAGEEDGSAWGARYLSESGLLQADGIVIGEPGGMRADFDELHLASRGIARLRFDVSGDQGHASMSDSSGAVNASAELARLLVAFTERFRPSTPPPPPSPIEGWTATVTGGLQLRGGVGYGVIPGRASFDAEVRTLPGMQQNDLTQQLEAFLAAERAANPRLRAAVTFDEKPRDWLPGTLVAEDDPLVGAARHAWKQTFGSDPRPAVFPGTTDAAFFHAAAGVPTLPALGPGLLARAHGADEWVSITALTQALSLYQALAERFCAEIA